MSLLSIVTSFCKRNQLTVPTAVANSSDLHIQQILSILNELVDDLTEFYDFQALRAEATHTTLAAELQGTIQTIAPGCLTIIPESMFNRTKKLPIQGPVSEVEWQARKALAATSGTSMYRIMSDSLYLIPQPAAGETIAFEYTKYAVVDNDTSRKRYFTEDTDTCVLPDRLLLLGLRWKWLTDKGLPSQSAGQTFNDALKAALSNDKVPTTLNMNGEDNLLAKPVVIMPTMSWPLT